MPIAAVRIVAVGALAQSAAAELAAAASRRLAVPCALEPDAWSPAVPCLPGRREHDADWLLARLAERTRRPGEAAVALTLLDLAVPIFTFVFGRAQRGGAASVVSLARLSPEVYGLPPDPELTRRRAVATILHELGHVAGLGHCHEQSCLMRFAPTVEAMDLRGAQPCAECGAVMAEAGLLRAQAAEVALSDPAGELPDR